MPRLETQEKKIDMKKMTWLSLLATLLAVSPLAFGAALVTKGANELGLEGDLDFATAVGTRLEASAKYAYFFWDRISLGVQGVVFNNDAMHQFGLGVNAEYNFTLSSNYKPLFGTDLVPFLGAAISYRHAKLFDEKESAVVFGGEGGVKFFLTDTTAITLSLVGELATEDIYDDDLEATNKDLSLRLGMRFYY